MMKSRMCRSPTFAEHSRLLFEMRVSSHERLMLPFCWVLHGERPEGRAVHSIVF